MNASDRLHRSRTLTLEGRFSEALTEFEWFHENALVEEPSLRGVRRSFALSYWAELGEQYAPALNALSALRDRGNAALLTDKRDLSLFADVASINRYLKDELATHQLFRELHKSTPEFAVSCFPYAIAAVVAAQDFHLALGYISSPAASLSKLLQDFNESVARAFQLSDKRRRAPRLQAYTSNFVFDVQLLLNVVRHTDGASEADQLARASIVGVVQESVRKRVARKLDA